MVKTTRIIFAVVIVLTIMLNFSTYAFASPPIQLIINGSEVKQDVSPVLDNGTTLVPIRVVSETLGAYVYWDGTKRQVEITYNGSHIVLPIGKSEAVVDGNKIALNVPAKIIKDTTMVPLRFVAESMGAIVDWIADSRTVVVEAKSLELTDVEYNKTPEGNRIELSFTGAVKYTSFFMSDSNQLVIDVPRSVLNTPRNIIPVGEAGIKQVRVGQFQINPDISRIVVDMTGSLPYEIESNEKGDKLYISIKNRVDDVIFKQNGDDYRAVIKTIGPPIFTTEELDNPYRLVFDIHNAVINTDKPLIEVDNKKVQRIRMAQFSLQPDIVRVVFDLKDKSSYSALINDDGYLEVLFSDTAVFKQVEHKSFNGKTRVELEFTKAVDYTAEFKDGKFSVTVSNSELKSKLKPYKVRDGIIEAISIDEGKSAGKPFVNFEFELPYYYRHEIMSCTPSKTIEIELYETPLKDMLIVVDPGHGGDAPGAIGSTGVKEKDLALDIAQRLNKLLISGGAETHMVRDSDISVPYQIRHNIANELNADIFVSIHINAYNNNKINGVETLYCPSDTKDSLKLAEAVHKAMLDRLDLADRGIFKRTDIVVLRETSMPAVMAEIGYITNPEDEKKLMNPEFRQQAAQALYNGLIEYLSR